ncbi:DUF664 domain-containing protein [soil metagenome]
MDVAALLGDAADRVSGSWQQVLDGLDADALTFAPDDGSNPIGWLAWHSTRIADDHVAHLAGFDQVWPEHAAAFDLGLDLSDHGYGHDSQQVAQVAAGVARAGVAALLDYLEATSRLTDAYLERVDEVELSRIVDDRWDPPVTAGVRFVSLISDNLQHAGQAAYLRGLHERAR